MSDKPDYEVGYGKPPKATQWLPNVSGNPKGRPRKSKTALPYERVLGLIVPFKDADGLRELRADEAFLRQLINRGIKEGGRWTSLATRAITICQRVLGSSVQRPTIVFSVYPSAGEINQTMRRLKMATKLEPYSPSAKMVIEPWLVQAALARLGDRQFSLEEQRVIMTSTRKPHTVQWPDWWTAKSGASGRGRSA
jgi:hypothetical protein